MQPLPHTQYHKLTHLIKDVNIDKVFAQAVIDQKQLGKILVDNTEKPNTAFIVHHASGFTLLCGKENNTHFNKKV